MRVSGKGWESELLPALQDGIQRSFGLKVHWEARQADVLVLIRLNGADFKESKAAEPLFMFMRGKMRQDYDAETDCHEEKYGLVLTPATRAIRMLVVESK
jgi:hypothetical protein